MVLTRARTEPFIDGWLSLSLYRKLAADLCPLDTVTKRQKTSRTDNGIAATRFVSRLPSLTMDHPGKHAMPHDANPQWVYDMNKNAHLKGRRRFKADLEDLELLSAAEYEAHGLRLKSASISESGIFHLLTWFVQA